MRCILSAVLPVFALIPGYLYAQDTGMADPNAPPRTSVSTVDEYDALKAKFQAEEAAYKAAEAAALAQSKAIEAQSAAALAKVGSVDGQDTITGKVDFDTQGGLVGEGHLLATRAIDLAALDLAKGVWAALSQVVGSSEPTNLLILGSTSNISAPEAGLFELNKARLGTFMDVGIANLEAALSVPTPITTQGADRAAAPLSLVGGLVEGFSNLGSFFQSDYKLGNLKVTEQANLDTAAIASHLISLASEETTAPGYAKLVVTTDNSILNVEYSDVLEELQPLNTQYATLLSLRQTAIAKAGVVKNKHPSVAAQLEGAAKFAHEISQKYEAFLNGLASANGADATMPLKIQEIIRNRRLKKAVDNADYILLFDTKGVAGYYTKKGLWNFLFSGPPAYTMGGSTASYFLIDQKSGALFSTGIVAKHAGYHSVSSVEDQF